MNKKQLSIITGTILSLIFILAIISLHNVDPSSIDWVTGGGGDNLQHYLGWRFFRESDWNRYFLFMRNLNYPVGTSIIVTDSNPLFCLFFKLIRNLLPDIFQFNGLWLVFSYSLLGFFAGLILWRLTSNLTLSLSGTLLIILNPVIMQRALIHDTLTAHWLILAAVWLFLNYDKKWNIPGWIILTETTLLIHIYFIPMIAFVLLLQMIHMAVKKQSVIRIILPAFVFAAALATGYFIFGYSHILPQTGSYGELSMNLNAFINPDSIPALLKSRPTNPLQYEGFNYWGIGVLLMLFFGIISGKRKFFLKILPFLIPCILLILASASNEIYFDNNLLLKFEIPTYLSSVLSVFRSSGRLVWPIYYLVLIYSIHMIKTNQKNLLVSQVISVLCVFLQFLDLGQFFLLTSDRFRNPSNQLAVIPNELEEIITDDIKNIFCSDGDAKTVDALSLYAIDHHKTFNKNANAREIRHIYGGDILDMNSLTCQQVKSDSVYIFLNKMEFPPALTNCENTEIAEWNSWILIKQTR